MWSRAGSQSAALMLVTTVLVGGCSDSVAPNQPAETATSAAAAATAGTAAQLQARTARGIDAEFARLAREIPGFGGMHYDKSGKLTIHLTKQQAGALARSGDVMGRIRSLAGAKLGRRVAGASATIQEAQYDYLQLQSWKSSLSKIFRVRGVVYTDIDEGSNRLRIGITRAASERDVLQALAQAGVPREAVVLTPASPITRVKTLDDRFRPTTGGIQIFLPTPSVGPKVALICTLGFNAGVETRPEASFFVTASHCSDVQGGNQRTPYFQPAPKRKNPKANQVAVEFRDPQYGNPGGLCIYEGARCRLSDALLARYRPAVPSDLGTIARTTFALQRIGSRIVDRNNPRWRIIGEFAFPFQGEIAHKVGNSTGWTVGPVFGTCVDTPVADTDIVLICQDLVFAGARPGDSGSPVFERVAENSSDVFLTGVLWGRTTEGMPMFAFSAIGNIEAELGPLTTEGTGLVAAAR